VATNTGADAEYTDVTNEVPVYAITGGKVLLARWASGYGGVVAIQHQLNNQPVVGIYGHLNPNQLPKIHSIVTAGQQIGILGTGGTHETDGERKHLHFGLVKGTSPTLTGYVPSPPTLLNGWIRLQCSKSLYVHYQ
jgi:murein DD-endopeptidase MepM/ murein hydrolase activator NlpD